MEIDDTIAVNVTVTVNSAVRKGGSFDQDCCTKTDRQAGLQQGEYGSDSNTASVSLA